MRDCATHSNAFQRRNKLKTTKPCCRGSAHPQRLAEHATRTEFGGVYGALTLVLQETGDKTGDGVIELPPDFCAHYGIAIGDEFTPEVRPYSSRVARSKGPLILKPSGPSPEK